MTVKFTNNAFSTLASSINSSVTTISLAAGTGGRFPSLSAGDVFYATLVDSSNNLEIVKVTARSTDTLTVVRAQDDTTARSFSAGDRIELRPVAAAFGAIQAYAPTGTISATTIVGAITELDSEKAPKDSPTFIGTVTIPTANPGDSTKKAASTEFVTDALFARVPSGVIVLWSGLISAIPAGWYLCNGQNGTPDLRDRFVVGAGSTYSPYNYGGSKDAVVVEHTHTATSTQVAHNHTVSSATNNTGYTVGAYGNPSNFAIYGGYTATTSSATPAITTTVNSTGSSGTNANLPPYYALAYIMKA